MLWEELTVGASSPTLTHTAACTDTAPESHRVGEGCWAQRSRTVSSTCWPQENKRLPHAEDRLLYILAWPGASLVAQMVKNLPQVQEIWVQSLGWEDPLEKGMATHSSFLAWKIPWTEEPGGLQSVGSQRVRQSWAANTFTFTCPKKHEEITKNHQTFERENYMR